MTGGLSLRQLEYLTTVADEGRLTPAAARLFVTVPTLSQQLKTLERGVGTALVERGANGVRLTAAGEAFLPFARAALRSARLAQEAARAADARRRAAVRLVTLPPLLPGLLPALVDTARAHVDAPLVVEVREESRQLRAAVRSGAADVAVGPRPGRWDGRIDCLAAEEAVIVCASDDPLAGRESPLENLLQRDWIVHHGEGWDPQDLTAGAPGGDALRWPFPVAEVPTVEAAVVLAVAGAGVTVAPRSALPDGAADCVIRLAPRQIRETSIYRAAGAAAPVERCCQALRTAVARAARSAEATGGADEQQRPPAG
ncbi:LysR family transcriptional regulator [Streptomyces lunalinharesii]|uniref:LysR family transcriptional regulator n=1 Tax=Streptomyces lunalinharesii TaxID=333384 RepID=A0ABN3RQQ7_9ACTN